LRRGKKTPAFTGGGKKKGASGNVRCFRARTFQGRRDFFLGPGFLASWAVSGAWMIGHERSESGRLRFSFAQPDKQPFPHTSGEGHRLENKVKGNLGGRLGRIALAARKLAHTLFLGPLGGARGEGTRKSPSKFQQRLFRGPKKRDVVVRFVGDRVGSFLWGVHFSRGPASALPGVSPRPLGNQRGENNRNGGARGRRIRGAPTKGGSGRRPGLPRQGAPRPSIRLNLGDSGIRASAGGPSGTICRAREGKAL